MTRVYGGIFSLIQFQPNVGRREGINIGVVLVCPELKAVRVKMTSDDTRVGQVFGEQDWERFKIAKQALATRLEKWLPPTEAGLNHFIGCEASNLVLLSYRQVLVADVEDTLHKLFEELVA